MTEDADGRHARAWYTALAAGLAPVEVAGWVVSAVADRWAFAAWALLAGAAYGAWLYRGFVATGGVTAAPLAVLAASWAVFALLLARHRQAWDLGFRAFLPGLYHPWAASPAVAWTLAALCGAGALHRLRRTPRRIPS
ncbi:MAG: hypothetical protein KDD11_01220 [Acidobacteria bacterium]|nr:hypothetical protein [Acidobacteriota bacterium]